MDERHLLCGFIAFALMLGGCADTVDKPGDDWSFDEPAAAERDGPEPDDPDDPNDPNDPDGDICEETEPPRCEGGNLSEKTEDGCTVVTCTCPDWALYHEASGKCVNAISPRVDGEPCERASECQSQFCDTEFVGDAYGVCVTPCDRDDPGVCPEQWHCVIRNDRDITGLCVPNEDEHPWGVDAGEPVDDAEVGPYVDLSVGPSHACAVRGSGEIVCWGNDEHGKATGPIGENAGFAQVEAGALFSCGLRDDGEPHCWGMGSDPNVVEGVQDYDQAVPADGPFDQITVGRHHACGLESDGEVRCWGLGSNPNDEGDGDFDQAVPPPNPRFTQVDAGRWHTCGITTEGLIECWGRNLYGELDVTGAGVAYTDVSAGNGYTCAVYDDTAQCWGLGSDPDTAEDANEGTPDDYDQAFPPPDSLAGVATGSHHSCGWSPDGHVTCWGESGWQTQTPAGRFDEVGVGDHYTCGLRIDGTLDCWGIANGGVLDHPSNTRFIGDAASPAVSVVDCTRDLKERVFTDGFSFAPKNLELDPHVVVEWDNTFQDLADIQTVTSGDPDGLHAGSLFDVEIPVGQSVCVSFAIEGTFDYFSRTHPEMTGTVQHSLQ